MLGLSGHLSSPKLKSNDPYVDFANDEKNLECIFG